jgi:hypothetical protein
VYNTQRLNRNDGPEDRSLLERCMFPVLPDFARGQQNSHYHIVQSGRAGDIGIFYDVGQGWGGHRVIPMTGRPHLPSSIGQWWGDSRGRWEGNTLVVDVTNFSPKRNYRESRERLHFVERWTRLDATTLEYSVTIDDPTTWTRPWTAKWELTKQADQPHRIYYEPRCHEGNYGLPSLLSGARAADRAFAEGKGPDPALSDTATDFGSAGGADALTAQ